MAKKDTPESVPVDNEDNKDIESQDFMDDFELASDNSDGNSNDKVPASEEVVHESSALKQPAADTRPMSSEERAIVQRVMSESDDWRTITEEDVSDYSLMGDPFKIPKEALDFERKKKFKFRWISRLPGRLDEVRSMEVPHKWWIVNASAMPELAHLCDPVLGSINKHDQMLVFKPWWMWELRQKIYREINEAQDRSAIEERDIEDRGGVQIMPGKKRHSEGNRLPGEVGRGDKIEYQETGKEDTNFSDLEA